MMVVSMEEEIRGTLNSIGMSKQESEVYIGLLKKPSSTANELSKILGKHRSNTYEILKALQNKGFVLESNKDSKRCFISKEPGFLLDYLAQKQEEIRRSLPTLRGITNTNREVNLVSSQTGLANVRSMLSELLEMKSDLYFWGSPEYILEMLSEAYFKEKLKNRTKEDYTIRVIVCGTDYQEDARLLKSGVIELRRVPGIAPPASAVIYGEGVFMLPSVSKATIVNIQNKETAEWFKANFLTLWNKVEHSAPSAEPAVA